VLTVVTVAVRKKPSSFVPKPKIADDIIVEGIGFLQKSPLYLWIVELRFQQSSCRVGAVDLIAIAMLY